MKTKHSGMALAWLVATLLLTACGGGGGVSSTGNGATYSLSGQVQKGPFSIGSQVTVNELDASLNPTGKVYNVQTSDDLGNFAVASKIGTNLVEIVGDGFYMDELTGQLAASRIQLRAVADLSVNATPTVNILTSLQEQRLKTLLSQGKTYTAANTQSQTEVLAVFGIDSTKINSLSTLYSMKINGTTDADSVLLATSVILSKMATNAALANSTTQPAELSNYISTIAAQISSAGTITNAAITIAKNLAATQIDLATVRTNIETYYANRAVSIVAPKFEEWVDKSGSGLLPQRLVPVSGLTFTDAAGVQAQQLITSNTITVSGLGAGVAAPVTVSAGTTLIKNNTAVSGTRTDAIDGDTIALRVTSLGYGFTNTSMITVGTSSATWRVTTRPLGGTISGLTGTGLVLQNNGGDNITIPAGSASFNFNVPVANGATYSVSVLTQPTSPVQECTVTNGIGTVGAAPSNVIVMCPGPITGLAYTDVSGVNPNQVVTSNAITMGGVGTGFVASVTTDANTTIIKNGTASGASATAIDGDSIALRVTSLGYSLTNTSTITIDLISATWRVTTKPLGGTISGLTGTGLVLQNNGGDNITIPAGGASFNFPTPISNLASYNVSVLTQPIAPVQMCSVSNGTGTVGSGTSNISVVCNAVVGFAYVTNYYAGTVSQYTIGAGGSLTPMTPATVAAGVEPHSITVDPSGKYAYVGNDGSTYVSQFTIGANGGLTAMATATVAAAAWPMSITVDPSGKYVYAACTNSNTVSQYTIGVDGSLTLMTPATVTAGASPESITVDPSGRYVYVANSNTVSQYTIGVGGSLTPMTPATVAANGTSTSIIVDPSGKYVYVVSSSGNSVSQYTIGTGGSLTPMTPATVAAGLGPSSITVDPSGKYAYVANEGGNSVSQFTIGANGGLTAMATATVSTGTNPWSITVDPSGKYAYVANFSSDSVSQYSIGLDGDLTPMAIATVGAGSKPIFVIAVRYQ